MVDNENVDDLSRGRSRPARVERAEYLEGQRDDADAVRVQRASDLAVEQALRNERINARFDRHDARFALINGSMERTATRLQGLERKIEKVGDAIDQMAEAARTREAIEAVRTKELHDANEKQISTRAFAIGVSMVIVTLLGLILAQTHLFS